MPINSSLHIVTCTRAAAFGTSCIIDIINGIFLAPTSAFTLLAHMVLHLLLALVVFFYLQLPYLLYCHMWWSHCYLHCVVVVVVVYM